MSFERLPFLFGLILLQQMGQNSKLFRLPYRTFLLRAWPFPYRLRFLVVTRALNQYFDHFLFWFLTATFYMCGTVRGLPRVKNGLSIFLSAVRFVLILYKNGNDPFSVRFDSAPKIKTIKILVWDASRF